MITPQLVDFIKRQTTLGITHDEIVKELSANGWTKEDINQGFKATLVANPDYLNIGKSHVGRTIGIIFVFILLAGGAAGYYFRNDLMNMPVVKGYIEKGNQIATDLLIKVGLLEKITISKEETNKVVETQTPQPQPVQNEVATVAPTTPTMVNGILNCEKDMSCFLNAINKCSPAAVEETKTISVFGMLNQTNQQTLTLGGLDSSKKCIFTSRVNDVIDLSYSPELIAMAKAEAIKQGKPLTEEQIKEGSKVPEDSMQLAKSTIGMTTKCSFDTTYLTGLFAKWNKGEYSSSDLTPGNCTIIGKDGKMIPVYTSNSSLEEDHNIIKVYNTPGSQSSSSYYDAKISPYNLGFVLLELKDDAEGHPNQAKLDISRNVNGKLETQTITLISGKQQTIWGFTLSTVSMGRVMKETDTSGKPIYESSVELRISK